MFDKDKKVAINTLKSVIEEFSCKDKRYEDGFVGGLFYSILFLEHGKEYADSKIDWNKIGRDSDYNYNRSESCDDCGC
jgi:hypothetical protein